VSCSKLADPNRTSTSFPRIKVHQNCINLAHRPHCFALVAHHGSTSLLDRHIMSNPSGLRLNAPSVRATRENAKPFIINVLRDFLFGRDSFSGIMLPK
jgi:hypothetical protein